MGNNTKGRKGQVSYFLLVGVILIVIAISFFYIQSLSSEESSFLKKTKVPLVAEPVKRLVDNCLKEVTIPGIYLLASNGGYIYTYPKVLLAEKIQVAYHLEIEQEIGPNKAYMESELERFITESLPICLRNFEGVESYQINTGKPEAKVSIMPGNTIIDLTYPLAITFGDATVKIKDFGLSVPIGLGNLISVKDEILSNIKGSEFIDLDFLASRNTEVILMPYDKQTIVYTLLDNASAINNAPFLFNFAVKTIGNSPPRMEFVPDFVLVPGKKFSYQLNATDPDNDVLRYYTENALIEMDGATGRFSFTPPTIGNYEIEVCVEDKYLAKDCKPIRFMIKNA